jgi:hypothetical protein
MMSVRKLKFETIKEALFLIEKSRLKAQKIDFIAPGLPIMLSLP